MPEPNIKKACYQAFEKVYDTISTMEQKHLPAVEKMLQNYKKMYGKNTVLHNIFYAKQDYLISQK